MAQGLTRPQVTKKLIEEKLVPSSEYWAAYSTVRKDLKTIHNKVPRMPVEMAALLFIERGELLYRIALQKVGDTRTDAAGRPIISEHVKVQYLAKAIEANRDIALAHSVNIRPRYVPVDPDAHDAIDPAVEAARAVIEKQRERERLEAIATKAVADAAGNDTLSTNERPN
jgi:hypothetical protein